jgi:hypothetical protein
MASRGNGEEGTGAPAVAAVIPEPCGNWRCTTRKSREIEQGARASGCIEPLYSGAGLAVACGKPYRPCRRPGDDCDHLSTEHMLPKSYHRKRWPAVYDQHLLAQAFVKPNVARNHFRYGEVPEEHRGCAEPVYPAAVEDPDAADPAQFGLLWRRTPAEESVFEPPDHARGVVARAMLYFDVVYGRGWVLEVYRPHYDDSLEVARKWHREYPVTLYERKRNVLIREHQKVGNPWIEGNSSRTA